MKKYIVQNLSSFRIPSDFRGRSIIYVQLWWIIQATLFKWSPQFAYKYRASLLRFFGASIGKNTVIRPTSTFTYPWKITIGDNSWIGDDVVLYSLGFIKIGSNSVISQRSYLCAGDHDYTDASFPIRGADINIGNECWIAADCYIAPGISIEDACVVGARSSVFHDLKSNMVCVGSPCRPIKVRDTKFT